MNESTMSDVTGAHLLIRQIAATRMAGDAKALADLFTDDASFQIVGFGAPTFGRDQIHATLTALVAQFEFIEWHPLMIVADGLFIASRHRLKVHHRPNGKVADTETAEFLSIENGLCTSFTQFADTALIAALAAR